MIGATVDDHRTTQHHVASMTGTDSSSDWHRCVDVDRHRRLGHADTNRSGRRVTQLHVASMTWTDSSSDRHRCADVECDRCNCGRWQRQCRDCVCRSCAQCGHVITGGRAVTLGLTRPTLTTLRTSSDDADGSCSASGTTVKWPLRRCRRGGHRPVIQ